MPLPAQLGKYVITATLGKGAMGVVYKAFDPNIRRPVALKTIRKDLLLDDQAVSLGARFRNEAQAAGRLSHPTPDHYLPLLYAAAATGDEASASTTYEGLEMGSISMRCVLFE